MSDTTMTETGKPGPAVAETVTEVQATFADEAMLNAAVALLTTRGFDHADFSLPKAAVEAGSATPEGAADTLLTDTDTRQARTLGTSMAGTIGAFAAAGATVATGGAAALAIAAAAAVGAGSAALAHGAGSMAREGQAQGRAESAARGELVLAVRTASAERVAAATAALTEAGAAQVAPVRREDAGFDSAGWTG